MTTAAAILDDAGILRRGEPLLVAPDTWVLPSAVADGPMAVHLNAMLVRAEQPVLVDTGDPRFRDHMLDSVFGLVAPEDLRWVFLSHDDADHYGNVMAVLDAAPNAVLVTSWYMTQRLASDGIVVPSHRLRFVADGETLDVGDRVLAAVRPPLYDSPTTRGLFDPSTGVYWASDAFGTPVPAPTAFADELDPDFYEAGFTTMQHWLSPWLVDVDPARFAAAVERVRGLGVTTIAGCHGPVLGAASLDRAFDLMRTAALRAPMPMPGQEVLDAVLGEG
jgi:flavorubredoxin